MTSVWFLNCFIYNVVQGISSNFLADIQLIIFLQNWLIFVLFSLSLFMYSFLVHPFCFCFSLFGTFSPFSLQGGRVSGKWDCFKKNDHFRIHLFIMPSHSSHKSHTRSKVLWLGIWSKHTNLYKIEAVPFRVSGKGTGFLGYWVPFNSIFFYRVPGSKVPEKWPSSKTAYPVTRIFLS